MTGLYRVISVRLDRGLVSPRFDVVKPSILGLREQMVSGDTHICMAWLLVLDWVQDAGCCCGTVLSVSSIS